MAEIYGTFGSVPSERPTQTSGAKPFGTRATPDTFGAQVGEARVREGAVHRDLGQKAHEFAMKYTGMINETMASERAQTYAIEAGKLQEEMKSKKGHAAAAYVPEYVETLTKLRNDMKVGIPNQAAMAFDQLTNQDEVYAINSGHSHAASQVREAHYKTAVAGADMYVAQALNPDMANNDSNMGYLSGNIEASLNSKFRDMPGTAFNMQTGMVEFLKTPEGEVAKDEMKRELDQYLGNAQLNRFSTLTEMHGVEKAYDIYNETKENVPPAAQAQLEAYFTPKIKDAKARGITGSIMQDAMDDYYKGISSPEAVKKTNLKTSLANAVFAQESGSGANAVTSPAGAVGGMQITPDTWETWKNIGIVKAGEDINNPVDNKAVGYRALQYYTDLYDGDVQRAMVAYFSGPGNVAPPGSPTPWIEDHSDGFKLTSEYVSEVSARMGDTKRLLTAVPTQADYFMSHYDDYQRLGAEYAEQAFPGDIEFAGKVRTYYEQKAADIMQQQRIGDMMGKKRIVQALNGEMTQGQRPTTPEQLEGISPQIKEDLDRLQQNDPDLYEKMTTNILAENARRDVHKNSPNFYRVLKLSLDRRTSEQFDEEKIHALLGRKDMTGLNLKDYNDLTQVLNEREKNPEWTDFLSEQMDEIEKAGGNIDGMGESRSLNFVRLMDRARKDAESKGVLMVDMVDKNSPHYLGRVTQQFMPTREQQIASAAKGMVPAVVRRGDVVKGYQYVGGPLGAKESWVKVQ